MPRGSRGPKPRKGTREYYVVVRGIPPQPMTEKPPKGILSRAAKDLALALSQQYGHAGVYTTEPRLAPKRGGHNDPYTWPDWRWRLIINYRADWYIEQAGWATEDRSLRPDQFGNARPQQYIPQVPMVLAGPPLPGYIPRPLPKR
jgi:hypothetical protein